MSSVPPVILKASGKHTATMIFLHGLGDTGFGWAGALNTIRPKYMKVICPTANSIPVTCNAGMSMPAWYDILDLSAVGGKREDLKGLRLSSGNLDALISEEEREVPRNRIILGGFSQGGALALFNILSQKSSMRFGAGIALSTYLPGGEESYKESHQPSSHHTPLLQVHGESDEVVPFSRGLEASKVLKSLFTSYKFKTYPHMQHEGTLEEMELIKEFIAEAVPDLGE